MMPLSMVSEGEPNIIKKVGGKEDTRRFLENLGFVVGSEVTVISEINGNMIVNIKNSRVAIGKDMANKIMVWFAWCIYKNLKINHSEMEDNYENFKRS